MKNAREILYLEVHKSKCGPGSHCANVNGGPAHTHMSRRMSDMGVKGCIVGDAGLANFKPRIMSRCAKLVGIEVRQRGGIHEAMIIEAWMNTANCQRGNTGETPEIM